MTLPAATATAPATGPSADIDLIDTAIAQGPAGALDDAETIDAIDTAIAAAPSDDDLYEDDEPAPAAKPEAQPDTPATPDPAKPDEPVTPAPDADAVKAAADAETALAAEIKDLGLKDRAAERFRALNATVKDLSPIKAELDRLGIKDLAELPRMAKRAQDADDMIEMVMSTGASSEQYGMTLDYLTQISKASQGDQAAAEKAWELWQSEGKALAAALGREVPGLYDPLAAHQDLLDEIAEGDLTKGRALEIARQRQVAALQGQAVQQQQGQAQVQQVTQQATDHLAAYDQQMVASDPTYMAKRAGLSQMVAFIKQTLPPSQWVAATQAAYASIPTPAAPAAAPAAPARQAPLPRVSAMRPGNVQPALDRAVYNDPMDAIDAGIERAG